MRNTAELLVEEFESAVLSCERGEWNNDYIEARDKLLSYIHELESYKSWSNEDTCY